MTNAPQTPDIAWERLDRLYRDTILDHARKPRNRTPLPAPDARAHVLNPFCGDEVFVDLSLRDGRVSAVCVWSNGCAVCQASASMMSELLSGRDAEEMQALADRFARMMRGEVLTEAERASLGVAVALAGVALFPTRVKCALLAWSTLDEALECRPKGTG